MKGWLKISALGLLALLVLTGCGSNQKKIDEVVTGIVLPTQGIIEPNQEVEESKSDPTASITPAQIPQGDFAQNIIIALDAGHGGVFSGAAYSGRIEKDLTLKMAQYVKEYLEDNYTGMDIFLVREDDSVLSKDVKEDLELRAQFAKDVNADALISLHFNASEDHSQQGAMILVSHQEHVTQSSKDLGTSILHELGELGILVNGNVTRNSNDMFDEEGKPLDYYAINRHSAARDIPGIIVEHCYMDHSKDMQFIDSDEDLRALAKADAIGIANYFGLPLKE